MIKKLMEEEDGEKLPIRKIPKWLLIIIGIFVLIIIITIAGGREKKEVGPPEEKVRIVEVTHGDLLWKLIEAKGLGNVLEATESRYEWEIDKKTEGKFIKVTFKIENVGKEVTFYFGGPDLIDGKGRRWKTALGISGWIPEEEVCVFKEIKPGFSPIKCTEIYEVAADSTDLKAKIGTIMPKYIDLEVIPEAKEKKIKEKLIELPPVEKGEIPIKEEKAEEKTPFQLKINAIKTADRFISGWGGSPYIWPDGGYKFVVINITIKNLEMEEKYVFFHSKLVVDKGYRYDPTFKSGYVREYGYVGGVSGSLRPTESITGTIAYEILKETVPVKLIVSGFLGLGKEIVFDLTKYKIEKIKHEPATISIIDYEIENWYLSWEEKVRISSVYPRVKNISEIPGVIKSVEVSVAGFKGKDIFTYPEYVSPNEEKKIYTNYNWEGLKEYESPGIDPGTHTITLKIIGWEDEVLASKSFTHTFPRE